MKRKVLGEDAPDMGRPQNVSLEHLIENGFARAAYYESRGSGRFDVKWLDGKRQIGPGVYLIVANNVVRYVGVTEKGLPGRVRSYPRTLNREVGSEQVQTPSRMRSVHLGLKELIESGKSVEVYIFSFQQRWDETSGLPIDRLKGLESGLICAIRPEWNQRGKTMESSGTAVER